MKGRKGLCLIPLILTLFLSTTLTNLPLSVATPNGTVLAVSPSAVDGIALGLTPGTTFSVNITVDDVPPTFDYPGMLGYQFWLGYNTSVLTVMGYESYYPFTVKIGAEINDEEGYVNMLYTFPMPEYVGLYAWDPVAVARVDFVVDGYGYSQLDLYNTKVMPISGPTIPHSAVDGHFVNIEIHDVAVTSVTPNQTIVGPGLSVSINVTVENQGTFTETNIDVTAYYNSTQIGTPKTVTDLVPKTNETLTFIWNTAGVLEGTYTLSVNASEVPGETDTDDNTYEDGTVEVIEIHDVAVTQVAANETFVGPGRPVSINVTVRNEGTMYETFNVTAYYNSTQIGTPHTVTDLAPSTNRTETFEWNTTGVDYGTYTISANATSVEGETDTADNTYEDGTVIVGERDIAVTSVTASPSSVFVGENMSINVTVKNQGIVQESFNVSTYYDQNLIETRINVTLDGGTSTTLTFEWNTTEVDYGTYTIKANATEVPGEIITDNNEKVDGQVSVALNDIAVTDVFAPTTAVVGQNITIEVTVENQGIQNTTFPVKAYYNKTATEWQEIGTQNVTDLTPKNETTVIFTWEITGVPIGTYTIKAEVPPLDGEIDITDNVFIATERKVTVNPEIHNIAVTSVTVNPTTVVVGSSVSINVTVLNQGNVAETFNASAYYDTTLINTKTGITLSAGESTTLTFTWNTTGVPLGTYTIKAEVSQVPGETDTTDNALTDDTVTVVIRDIVILTVTVNPTQAEIGQSVTISVTVKNEGTLTETNINVTAKYDSTVIGTKTVPSLPKGASKTLSFAWTTTGINPGTYTISANASVMPGETNVENNVKIDGQITVKLSSTISISVTSDTFTVGETTTISGSITPTRAGVTVTISYMRTGEDTWNNLTTQTDENGQYSFEWKPTTAGTYELKTSWEGDATTFGDESDPQTLTVKEAAQGIPLVAVAAVAGIAIVIVIAILLYTRMARKSKPT